MKKPVPAKPIERLFPFVLRARLIMVGRELLLRRKRQLHFVLITEDLSPKSRAEILAEFAHYPVVQHYTAEDLERFFGIRNAKVIGFQKSGLAQSVYAELKDKRINKPTSGANSEKAAPHEQQPAEGNPAAKSGPGDGASDVRHG